MSDRTLNSHVEAGMSLADLNEMQEIETPNRIMKSFNANLLKNHLIQTPSVEAFIPQKKVKGKAQKKAKRQQLPPMMMPSSLPLMNASSLHSSSSITPSISGSEADYLARQISSTSSSYFPTSSPRLPLHASTSSSTFPVPVAGHPLPSSGSMLPVEYKPPPVSGVIKSRSAGNASGMISNSDFEGEKVDYLMKIVSLEKQVELSKSQLEKKEKEIEKRDQKVKTLTMEIESLQKSFSKEFKKLGDSHELEVMKLKDSYEKEKSLLLSAGSSSSSTSSSSNTYPYFPTSSLPSQSNKGLFDQLEMLINELKKNQESFNEERNSLQLSHQNQLFLQEKRLKSDLSEMKCKMIVLEEELAKKEENSQSSRMMLNQLQAKNEQLEDVRRGLLHDQTKLRSDLKNLQQSIQATYRLESSSLSASSLLSSPGKVKTSNANAVAVNDYSNASSSSLPSDLENMLKIHDAKYEAKLRQMNNKLEFMKSQLETERKELDDTKSLLSNAINEKERIASVWEKKLQNSQKEFDEKLNNQEEKITANYEKRMSELTNLQRQLIHLTNTSNELNARNQQFSEQEEAYQQSINKLQVVVLNYQTEIGSLKKTIALLEQETSQGINKVSMLHVFYCVIISFSLSFLFNFRKTKRLPRKQC
jgi:hypothetical protein